MGLRKLIRQTFGFSRSQTNGLVILIPLMSIALFSEPVYRWWVSQREEDFSNERAYLDSLSSAWELQQKEVKVLPATTETITFFSFNPNEVTTEELKDLGFSAGLSKRLIKYRESGGVFRIKNDVKKLYGMDSLFFGTIKPYILLPDKLETPKPTYAATGKKERTLFDLNNADTTQLKTIYGVGSKLSQRIVKYRDKLGGFVKQEQLNEVYGLDSAVVNKVMKASFVAHDFNPKKISINTADEITLSSHPYINKKVASAIVSYRYQHGKFQSAEELKNVKLVDEVLVQRLTPYILIE